MSEQLRHSQFARNGRTVDGDKRGIFAYAFVVDCARDQVLSGPGLATHKYGQVQRREAAHRRGHPQHRRGVADEPSERPRRANLAPIDRVCLEVRQRAAQRERASRPKSDRIHPRSVDPYTIARRQILDDDPVPDMTDDAVTLAHRRVVDADICRDVASNDQLTVRYETKAALRRRPFEDEDELGVRLHGTNEAKCFIEHVPVIDTIPSQLRAVRSTPHRSSPRSRHVSRFFEVFSLLVPMLAIPLNAEASGIAQPIDAEALPAPEDLVSGHVFLSAGAGLERPTGQFASGYDASPVSTWSRSFRGSATVGVGRGAALGVSTSYAPLAASDGCSGCGGKTWTVGLELVHHVAQGFGIDPWASFGVGYRATSLTLDPSLASSGLFPGDATSLAYKGVDFARIGLGADFFPTRGLGLGLYVDADVGAYASRPGPATTASVYAFLGAGLRVTVDPVAWMSSP